MGRVLFPLLEDEDAKKEGKKRNLVVDPLAGIHHSSNKYVDNLKLNPKQAFIWDNVEQNIKPLPCLVNTRPDYVEKDDLS
jgi:hypothetical protein